MPKNLSSTGLAFPTQTSPLAGEPRTAGSVETPFQNATDRSQWCKDRIEHIDPTKEGARRLRRFASVAALKAVTDLTDKGVALIDGVAVYEYDALSLATELSPAIITPTSVGAGAGRWIAVSFGNGALNVANGVPQLNASARVPTERLEASGGAAKIEASSVVNGLVYVRTVRADTETSTSSSTFVDMDGAGITVDLAIGDILVADFHVATENMSDTSFGELRVALLQPDTVVRSLTQGAGYQAVPFQSVSVKGVGAATQAGTHTIKLQLRMASGVTGVLARNPTGSLLVVRP